MSLSLREERIQELTDLIAARILPRRVEVLATGEMLSREAMELARLYQRAAPKQRAVFDALVTTFAG